MITEPLTTLFLPKQTPSSDWAHLIEFVGFMVYFSKRSRATALIQLLCNVQTQVAAIYTAGEQPRTIKVM